MVTHFADRIQKCPMDFSYIGEGRWDTSSCQGPNIAITPDSPCCSMVFRFFILALANYLKNTSRFYLPDIATASSCIYEFQQALSPLVPSTLVPPCLGAPSTIVSNPSLCAGVQTLTQWRFLVPTNLIDSSCKGDISALAACNLCVDAQQKHINSLTAFSNNSVNCIYFTTIYLAGEVNEIDPTNPRNAWCLLGLPVLPQHHRGKTVAVYVSVGIAAITFVLLVLGFVFHRVRCRQLIAPKDFFERCNSLRKPNTGPLWLDYNVLKTATDNFSERNLIGRGGFGAVYKGTFPDGHLIAVKRFLDSVEEVEFKNEMDVISTIRHRNLVTLRGCCVRVDDDTGPQRLLVYDYYPNGNLENHLFCPSSFLTWPQRENIILGVAHGLAYLHQGVNPPIYHRDVKPTNILLDSHMNALVADFGLARIMVNTDALTCTVAGTYGYMAPEYALYGHLTEMSDVYGFGVLALVIMSGRPALMQHGVSADADGNSDILITDWAWRLMKSGRDMEVLEQRIREGTAKAGVIKFLSVAILCAHVMVAFRPTMNEAIKMLEGHIPIPHIPDRYLPFQCSSGLAKSLVD